MVGCGRIWKRESLAMLWYSSLHYLPLTILPATSLWDQISAHPQILALPASPYYRTYLFLNSSPSISLKRYIKAQRASKIFHKAKDFNFTFLGWCRTRHIYTCIYANKHIIYRIIHLNEGSQEMLVISKLKVYSCPFILCSPLYSIPSEITMKLPTFHVCF